MGPTISVIKTLSIPAVISLLLFLISTFVLVPLWQRYRNRYSQYLPLETISNQTLSIRGRMQGAIARFFIAQAAWRARATEGVAVAERNSFDSEEGEELGEVDGATARRVVDRQRDNQAVDNTRRLSRDLEEGFMDDSDEEDDRTTRR
ncbi:hypothetical protein VTI74DRAFT_8035 [Chaetomium olivicolor]